MEVVLESLASCSMMDIIGILKKQRKDIVTLRADIDADRASEHPKVFTAIRIVYRLSSPDCSVSELEKAIGLSIDRYCSVSAMLKRSGCSISWKAELSDSNSKP
jgi:putative redox protein